MLLIKKSSLMKVSYFLVAIIYAYALTLIPHEYFKDRQNYMTIAKYYDLLISERSGRSLFSSEMLFLYINKYLGYIFNPENIVYFYVFIINLALSMIFFLKSRNVILAILGLASFFLLPFGFSFQLGSLRQSLAIIIVMLAVLRFKSIRNLSIIIFISGLIHTSLFSLLPFLIADHLFIKTFGQKRVWSRLILHLSIALFISLFLKLISQFFDISKLEFYFEMDYSTGAFFIFFIPILIFNIYQYWRVKKIDTFELISIIGLISYLVFYFLTPISGRLITIFIPFIYLSLIKQFKPINILLLTYTLVVGIYFYSIGAYKIIMTI